MNSKSISFEAFKSTILADQEVMAAYLEEKKNEEIQELLQEMRIKDGLTSSEVAKRMGISQPAICKIEKNAIRASLMTLQRYAKACNSNLRLMAE